MMNSALYFDQLENNKVQCRLCPHNCIIIENKSGKCQVRKNVQGKLISLMYGRVSSLHFDPIEKKPLYKFFPGSIIFSIGSIGCNLHCRFCQNYSISQCNHEELNQTSVYTPDEIIEMAGKRVDNIGIAYTYNEPTVWFEYMLDISKAAKQKGMKNVMVTNGFINEKPLSELLNYMDAFNVDLKAFSESFYKEVTSSALEPVLQTLKQIRKSKKHLEITCLIIPELNDQPEQFEKMVQWIREELSEETILHLSRYFPRYKLNITQTPIDVLLNLQRIAKRYLKNVYLGNV